MTPDQRRDLKYLIQAGMKSPVADYGRAIRAALAEVDRLRAENDALARVADRNEEGYARSHDQVESLTAENARLNEEVASRDRERDSLQEVVVGYEARLVALEADAARLDWCEGRTRLIVLNPELGSIRTAIDAAREQEGGEA